MSVCQKKAAEVVAKSEFFTSDQMPGSEWLLDIHEFRHNFCPGYKVFFCEGKQAVENLFDHHPTVRHYLKSYYNPYKLDQPSGFHFSPFGIFPSYTLGTPPSKT